MIGKATGKSELSSRSTPPPVQGLIHSAQHDLQDGISREAIPIIHRLPANRIDHIPDAEPPSQGVVERFQTLGCRLAIPPPGRTARRLVSLVPARDLADSTMHFPNLEGSKGSPSVMMTSSGLMSLFCQYNFI